MERFITFLKYASKAFVGAAVAGISALLLVVTGNETFTDVTFAEWLLVLLAIFGTFGATYKVTNKE